jgi:tetratricopeptide (TPR) repeat protein
MLRLPDPGYHFAGPHVCRISAMSRKSRHRPKATRPAGPPAPRAGQAAKPAEPRDALLLEAALAYQAQRLRDAEALCVDVLALEARYPPAMQMLAMIAARTARPAMAIELLRDVVLLDRRSVDARNELGALLRGDLHFSEAIAVGLEAVRLAPGDAGTHNNLGVSYLGERRLAEAAASFERAIALQPKLAVLHYNLGHVRQLQGLENDAIASLSMAIALAPDFAEAHARLGHLLLVDGSRDDAEQCFARALALLPDSAQGRLKLARTFAEIGRLETAERVARAAVAVAPDSDDAHQRLGEILQQLGRFDDAIVSFARVAALQPARTEAYLGIAFSKTVTEAEVPMLERMRALLGDERLVERDRANLHYALGKAADDGGNYAGAMRHFDDANRIAAERLRRSGRSIDRVKHAANIDRLIGTFTPDLFARHADLGSQSELPVLIVGMIRSGTTLIEQIVSSHPEVGGGGELRFWGDRGVRIGDALAGVLGADEARDLAAGYCRLLQSIAPAARRITDKMPTNFLLLGLVHLLFPRARVIHCRRHPVDNCLSMFFTPYTRSPDFAHDRSNLVFYYEQYLRLMEHWRRALPPDRLLEIDYEVVVEGKEQSARQIIEFCGLDWNDACLRPERNARAITTPSLWQARQPVYRTSIARWRRYEAWLGEFRPLLSIAEREASSPR